MKNFIKFLVISLALIPTNGEAAYTSSESDVNVTISATMVGKFIATTDRLTVLEKEDNIVATVDATSLTTNNSLRDEHMKLDLGVTDYPTVTLTVPKKDVQRVAGKVQGMLNLHGKNRPVVFIYHTTGNETKKVDARMEIKFTDWDVPARRYMGFGVKENVEINVKFTLNDN